MKTALIIFAAALAISLSPSLALTHGGGNHGGGRHGGHEEHAHDQHHFCKHYLPKAGLPDFDNPPWEVVDTFGYGFTFTFYHDTERPEIPIAAMKVYGIDPVTKHPYTRITWQMTNEEVGTVRLEINEMICGRSIYADDGSFRDLLSPHVDLRNKKELENVPGAAKRAYDSLAGKSVSRGQISTKLATETKKKGVVEFRALIVVFDTPEVALFFYLGVDGGAVQTPEWRRIVEIRWKENGSVRVWSRKELTLDDGGRILIKPPLHQRPEFAPQASDSVF